jgi:hypothetical protein
MKLALAVLVATGLWSCTEPQSEPNTSAETSAIGGLATTCGCDDVERTLWIAQPITWSGNANNMMVIITGDPENSSMFYAFGVANGTDIAWLYHVPKTSYVAFNAKVDQAFDAVLKAFPNRFGGGSGGLIGGPHPVGPVGVPPTQIPASYIARVIRTAGTLIDSTRATLQYDTAAVGP